MASFREHIIDAHFHCRLPEIKEGCGEIPEAGVQENTIMRFGQMNEPPGARFVVGHVTFAIAEYTSGTTSTGIFYQEKKRILMKNTRS